MSYVDQQFRFKSGTPENKRETTLHSQNNKNWDHGYNLQQHMSIIQVVSAYDECEVILVLWYIAINPY